MYAGVMQRLQRGAPVRPLTREFWSGVTPPQYGVVMGVALAVPQKSRASVRIDAPQIERVGLLIRDRFGDDSPAPERWDDPKFWNVDASERERCQYLAIGNSINFRFWSRCDHRLIPSEGTILGERLRGSMYMWRRLRLAIQDGQLPVDADELADLDENALRRAFVDDDGNSPLSPGWSDRVANIRDLGRRLADHWGGLFENLVSASNCSLESFATLSAEFRAFDDPVKKLTMVNAIMLSGSGLAHFDTEPLPGIDYHLMRQALRQGLVVPPPELARRLLSGADLDEADSRGLRLAIRDALVEVADKAGISTAVLDNLYWMNKRVCSEVAPHCSSCIFNGQCSRRTVYGSPVEWTRYY